jgi:hypothetical protein
MGIGSGIHNDQRNSVAAIKGYALKGLVTAIQLADLLAVK